MGHVQKVKVSWLGKPSKIASTWQMTKNCLTSQMTGFDTYFSFLRVKVDIPYQKVIVYVYHLTTYRKTVSLICSLYVMVSAYIIWYRRTHMEPPGQMSQVIFCSLLCISTNNIHVKNSNAKGTCTDEKRLEPH